MVNEQYKNFAVLVYGHVDIIWSYWEAKIKSPELVPFNCAAQIFIKYFDIIFSERCQPVPYLTHTHSVSIIIKNWDSVTIRCDNGYLSNGKKEQVLTCVDSAWMPATPESCESQYKLHIEQEMLIDAG